MLAAIFLTLAAILDNSNTAREEAEKQKKRIQIWTDHLRLFRSTTKKRNAGTHTRALLMYIPDYTERGYNEINGQEIIFDRRPEYRERSGRNRTTDVR